MQIIQVEQNSEEWREKRKRKVLGSHVDDLLACSTGTKEQGVEALDKFGVEYPMTKTGTPKGTKAELEEFVTPEVENYLMSQAPKKLQYYQLIADHIAVDTHYEYDENGEIAFNDSTMMDRGHILEQEAADILSEKIDKELVQVGICVRDDDPDIGNSPDRLVKSETGVYTEAVEIKCIKTAKHIQALLEGKIPAEYTSQAVQYFVVNDDLQTLYFCFYDPRIQERYACRFHYFELHRSDPEIAVRIPQFLAYERMLLKEVKRVVEELTF